jgi:hypothetical protein
MIEYIFKFYGIFCDNKWTGYLTTGLTLSAFSTTIFALKFLKSFNSDTNEIFFKLFLFLLSLLKISNYLIIKYKSSELIELNNKLKKFQKKCRISEHLLNIFSIFSILFSILLAFIATKIFFCESFVTKVFRDFNDELDSIPMPNFIKVFVLLFYPNSWYVSIQLLYIELKSRYISIIKEFRKEVLNENTEPDGDVLILTQKYVHKINKAKKKNKIYNNLN